MPQMGESVTEGTIVRWIKKVGDAIDRDEPFFEISTDKVDAEIPSPVAGVLTEIRVHEGETVAVNSVVGVVGAAGDLAAASPIAGCLSGPTSPPPAVQPPVAQPAAAERGHAGRDACPTRAGRADGPSARSSPLVRRIAKEHHVDISQIAGSGSAAASPRTTFSPTSSAARRGRSSTHSSSGDRVEPLSVMRKKIAEHMVLSRRTSAHVHSVFHVNFSTIDETAPAEERRIRAGGRAPHLYGVHQRASWPTRCARHPILNASLDGENVVYRKDINLGIAVALDVWPDRARCSRTPTRRTCSV